MNNIIASTAIAFALFGTSFAYAGPIQIVNHTQAATLMAFGSVSVSDAYTADQVERELGKKAENAGASHFRITSIQGNNLHSGTAVLYR